MSWIKQSMDIHSELRPIKKIFKSQYGSGIAAPVLEIISNQK